MNHVRILVWRRLRSGLLVVLTAWAAFASGCSGVDHEQVTGRVTFEGTGEPFPEARVVVLSQDKKVSADGVTDADGKYVLGTLAPGDGLPAGKYRALISPPVPMDPDEEDEEAIDPSYKSFDTSGLTLEVQAGENTFDIQVRRPGAAG